MNPFKLMMMLILLCVMGLLIAVAVFVFQLNLEIKNPGEFTFALWWGFVKTHPMYSFGIISPIIVIIGVLVKIARSKLEKHSFI